MLASCPTFAEKPPGIKLKTGKAGLPRYQPLLSIALKAKGDLEDPAANSFERLGILGHAAELD
jgi:hypothetical protein